MRKYELTLNGKPFTVQLLELSAEEATFEVNGRELTVAIDRVAETIAQTSGVAPAARQSGAQPAATTPAPAGGSGAVVAPIPGSILAIYVKVGEAVRAGQPLYKMEAMKMENEINAQLDGTIAAINMQVGDSVNQGQELILIAPEDPKRRKTDN